jgi:cytochrome c
MKKTLILAATLALAPVAALADDAATVALAHKNGCLACHAVDKKVVGPSYKEVAAKYRNDKTAQAKLEQKVKLGGTGVWGAIPMPPNGAASDADIKALVTWILALK